MENAYGSGKILTLEPLLEKLRNHRAAREQIVFTNGCFDILHAGHVRYLASARSEGDILVVGLNSDVSVREIKGEKRPIVPQDQRAAVLSGLACVNYIALFDEPDPLILIKSLLPDVLVKGEDWNEVDIIGAEIVKKNGGKVIRVPVVPDISTSRIIERIAERF